jgi:hypothetical protein
MPIDDEDVGYTAAVVSREQWDEKRPVGCA